MQILMLNVDILYFDVFVRNVRLLLLCVTKLSVFSSTIELLVSNTMNCPFTIDLV